MRIGENKLVSINLHIVIMKFKYDIIYFLLILFSLLYGMPQ